MISATEPQGIEVVMLKSRLEEHTKLNPAEVDEIKEAAAEFGLNYLKSKEKTRLVQEAVADIEAEADATHASIIAEIKAASE